MSLHMQDCRGAGLGLRPAHLFEVVKNLPDIPWFEVHICNFLGGGLNRALLHKIRDHYPLSFHGVSLNLGGIDPIDHEYLQKLKRAVDEFEPALISEHACFTALSGHYYHDLMPVPYTAEAVQHMVERIRIVQETLERKILIENVSRYYRYNENQLSEEEFLLAVCEAADCDLILDLNNAYVNQHNLGESLDSFIAGLPINRIAEIHLAGYSEQDGMLIDTHSAPVSEAVWDIFSRYQEQLRQIPCLIEWDSQLPDFTVLMQQQQRANCILNQSATENTGP